ncbi:MAG: aminopeptidase P family protein [Candidatus Nitrosothermus koennekii]|nr:MAG: aminopeptidase P family protein [Candidatus Nitrosothermus koennekii]
MDRLKRIRDNMEDLKYDTLVAFEPENIFYLTGFWGEAIAVLNKYDLLLIAPKLEVERAKKSRATVIESERGSDMINILAENMNGRVCTDCNDYNIFKQLEKVANVTYNTDIFYNARVIKDDDEINSIKKASMLLDKLFSIAEKEIKIGMSELEIQALLLYEGLKVGLLPTSYKFTLHPLIVASGKNSSLPHAQPTSRKVMKGDLITIDLTLRYNGYVSDATRTFAIGSISSDKKRVYSIVKEAQEEGIKKVHDGIIAGDIDKVCRDIITKNNYGEYFIHSTGHGIGLEVHEPPWIRANSNYMLKDRMTITIEPGIYLNNYGVRIEDSILVTKNGCEILNKYTKDLITV